jgi:hypothetical protein
MLIHESEIIYRSPTRKSLPWDGVIVIRTELAINSPAVTLAALEQESHQIFATSLVYDRQARLTTKIIKLEPLVSVPK